MWWIRILLCCVAVWPCQAGDEPFVSELLSNGLRVTLVEQPENPIVATQLWYHVGSANETASTRGFAHLFEHLMFGGTPRFAASQLDQLHHRFGGDSNAYTSFDETVYTSELSPAGVPELLAIEADRMVNLTLSETNLANEKRIVTEELRLSVENNLIGRLLTAVQAKAISGHPYDHSPVGTKEDIAAATLELAQNFYRQNYRPDRAHLVIVGPIDREVTLNLVRELFSAIPAGTKPPSPDFPTVLELPHKPRIELVEDIPPVEVALQVFPLPDARDPDAPAVEVMIELLAGGNVDLIEEELVRRQRKAVVAGTESFALRRGALIGFYAAALPYRRERTAWRLMEQARATLAQLDWLSDETLVAAKRRIVNTSLAQNYYAAARASAVGRSSWWEGDPSLAWRAEERIGKVTRADVARVFAQYIAQVRPFEVYVRPERVPLLVRLFGWLYPLVSR